MIFSQVNALRISVLASVVALGAAFVAQYGFNLLPCVLCLYQRWPYAVVIAIGIVGLTFAKTRRSSAFLFLILIAAGFAVTAGIGGFHVGVEQGWWAGTAECAADTGKVLSMEDLKAQILDAPIAKCDEPAWQMLGISMAGYNLIFASLLAVYALAAAFKGRKTGEELA